MKSQGMNTTPWDLLNRLSLPIHPNISNTCSVSIMQVKCISCNERGVDLIAPIDLESFLVLPTYTVFEFQTCISLQIPLGLLTTITMPPKKTPAATVVKPTEGDL